jgi:hypothetical protein
MSQVVSSPAVWRLALASSTVVDLELALIAFFYRSKVFSAKNLGWFVIFLFFMTLCVNVTPPLIMKL